MKNIKSAIYTNELNIINIEAMMSKGLPAFNIVGLASTSIKESVDRIKSAFANLDDFTMPCKKIVINLSPSDIPKNGSYFDLAIALLVYFYEKDLDNDYYVFGELGLNGDIKSTSGLFSILLFLARFKPNSKVLVPKELASEVSLIYNLQCYAVGNLLEAFEFFTSEDKEKFRINYNENIFNSLIKINNKSYIKNTNYPLDFIDIRGQEQVKLACKIASLGMHNIMLEGSPGSGKSMCAKRLVYIMPPLSVDEILENNAYRSLNGEKLDFSSIRSFRSPHRSSTISSILGGGTKNARIGEIALANNGVLFFDEFTYFNKQIIESLREPLEDNLINISRVNSKISYKTKFLFISALNPCPCGNLFKKEQNCKCLERDIIRYKSKISEPIYDRIDLYVAVDEVDMNAKASVSSKDLADEILKAFIFQKEIRKQDEFNGKLSDEDIKKYCILEDSARDIFNKAINNYHLSARAANKVLKVARSLADFEERLKINEKDIKIALSFRYRAKH
ncbi:YifB family Mg chelatase-like AAA ATPase [Campylobacter sp. RM12647]|uniref:YifB family Mg chelatase-like AAA ATPase n=1 Tax=Campylobacter sp. RM12647 TaxID=2735737 RepID=UPI001D98B4AD|nr:YifB family Mg chelatase-like AAA ATPase [Campylobacter sp. RM12647]